MLIVIRLCAALFVHQVKLVFNQQDAIFILLAITMWLLYNTVYYIFQI